MQRKPKTYIIAARALTDPNPAFVSIVGGGANQAPFRAVKMDEDTASPSETTAKENLMAQAELAPGHDIVALKFSTAAFADENAVKAWLDEGGYDGYDIEAGEKEFTVSNKSVEFEEGSTQKVEGAVKGLTVYVGKVKVEEETEKTEEEAADDAALTNASHVEPQAVIRSEDATEGEAASDEPEAEAEFDATKADEFVTKVKGMYEVSELAYVLMSLKYLVMDADYTGMADEDVNKIKSAAGELIDVMGNATEDMIKNLEDAFKAMKGDGGTAEASTEEPAEDAEKDEAEADAAPAEDAAAPEGEAAEKSDDATEGTADEPAEKDEVDPVLEAIAGLKTFVEEGLKQVNDKVDATKSEIDERFEAVESTGQTRKGADVTGKGEAPAEDAKKAEVRSAAKTNFARAMGHPDPTRA